MPRQRNNNRRRRHAANLQGLHGDFDIATGMVQAERINQAAPDPLLEAYADLAPVRSRPVNPNHFTPANSYSNPAMYPTRPALPVLRGGGGRGRGRGRGGGAASVGHARSPFIPLGPPAINPWSYSPPPPYDTAAPPAQPMSTAPGSQRGGRAPQTSSPPRPASVPTVPVAELANRQTGRSTAHATQTLPQPETLITLPVATTIPAADLVNRLSGRPAVPTPPSAQPPMSAAPGSHSSCISETRPSQASSRLRETLNRLRRERGAAPPAAAPPSPHPNSQHALTQPPQPLLPANLAMFLPSLEATYAGPEALAAQVERMRLHPGTHPVTAPPQPQQQLATVPMPITQAGNAQPPGHTTPRSASASARPPNNATGTHVTVPQPHPLITRTWPPLAAQTPPPPVPASWYATPPRDPLGLAGRYEYIRALAEIDGNAAIAMCASMGADMRRAHDSPSTPLVDPFERRLLGARNPSPPPPRPPATPTTAPSADLATMFYGYNPPVWMRAARMVENGGADLASEVDTGGDEEDSDVMSEYSLGPTDDEDEDEDDAGDEASGRDEEETAEERARREREKAEKLARLQIERDIDAQKDSLAMRYSRECDVCFTPNPRRRVATHCGHFLCLPCAEIMDGKQEKGKVKCPSCRSIVKYIRLYETLVREGEMENEAREEKEKKKETEKESVPAK